MRQAQKFLYTNGNDLPPTAIDLDKVLLKDLLFNRSPAKVWPVINSPPLTGFLLSFVNKVIYEPISKQESPNLTHFLINVS